MSLDDILIVDPVAERPKSKKKKKPKKVKKLTVIVDGDIVAYRAASATDGRTYSVTDTDGAVLDYKYKKEAAEYCNIQGLNTSDIKLTYKPEPESHACHNAKAIMGEMLKEIYEAKGEPELDVRVFISGEHNFRNSVNTSYKSSRKNVRRPANLTAVKEYLTNRYNAESMDYYEADDLIHMEARKHDYKNNVICSIDKDLYQIPGCHFNFVKNEFRDVSRDTAKFNFWTQVLTGDATDDIDGIKGVGPVKAAKVVKGCKTDAEYYKTVLDAYFKDTKVKQDEEEVDYVTRVIRKVSDVARLVFLVPEPKFVWQPPQGISNVNKKKA